jgi:hypothetical protein
VRSDPPSTAKARVWGRAPLAVKLGSAITALGVVTLVVTVVASAQLSRMNAVATGLADNNLGSIAEIGAVQKAAQATVADVLRHDIANNPSDIQAAQQAITTRPAETR